jgi:putative oxidoreductase
MKFARLVARLIIGILFIGHGTQKLKGWFGGPGIEGTTGMMESLDLHPPRRHAIAAGVAETTGGALLAAGLLTPLASASLIGVMITAIRTVHGRKGVWSAQGGYEYNLVLIAALLALAEEGPGSLSLDNAFGLRTSGVPWSLGALALGTAASIATVETGRSSGAHADPA